MGQRELNVVTGAFGFTGRHIARRLLDAGKRVVNLTGHPDRPSPFEEPVAVAAFNFDSPARLTESLRGAATLFNTYWIRFEHGGRTFEQAIANTRTLLGAAKAAGVRRIVHLSITNPSKDSPLPYFRGKAVVEEAIAQSGLSYAILRPTVIFGPRDILINNIAWMLRRFPVFAVAGSGDYRLQPVFVGDVADLAVSLAERTEDVVVDAVGPETFTFEALVRLIASAIGRRARLVHVRPALSLQASRVLGRLVGDVVLTRAEIEGLMADLLVSAEPPTGHTRLSDWLEENADGLGRHYASELERHYR